VTSRGALVAVAIMAVLAASVWRPLFAMLERPRDSAAVALSPLTSTAPWQEASPFLNWKPRYQGYTAELSQTFRKDGVPVSVYIAYYTDQAKGRELVTSANLLVARDDWKWRQTANGTAVGDWAGHAVTVDRAMLSGSPLSVEAWQLFWIDGHVTTSPYLAKALLVRAKLFGRGDDSALVVIYTPSEMGDSGERLRSFMQAMSGRIERALIAARGGAR
jgi:EpsI family protein